MSDPALSNIPELLRGRSRWLVWKLVQKAGKSKADKIPYYIDGTIRHGEQGCDADRAKLATYNEAVTALERGNGEYAGVGFAMLSDNNLEITGLDLDNCISEAGDFSELAEEFTQGAGTYAEISPSGRGLRLFFLGAMKDAKNHGLGVEVFCTKGFLTVTGRCLNGSAIRPMPAELRARIESLFAKPKAQPKPKQPAPSFGADQAKLESALAHISPDIGYGEWLRVGMGIQAELGAGGFSVFDAWSSRGSKYPGSAALEQKWKSFEPGGGVTAATVYQMAQEAGWRSAGNRSARRPGSSGVAGHDLDNTGQQTRGEEDGALPKNVGIEDFRAYMPMHQFIFTPSRELWPASSVNARVAPLMVGDKAIKASEWLDKNRPVEQMLWAPGEPMLISGRLISNGGWIVRADCTTFNLYIPPEVEGGDAGRARRWLDHVRRVYPADAEHIVKWCAHRVQRPGEKINHALVLGGLQGIGKDTLLEPVKSAVGPWNFHEVSPVNLLGRFNGFVKSVILRVSEARDLGDVDRYSFYDHMKVYTAAPPDVLRCDEKNIREHAVMNVCGVVITSNHKQDGIYLPADDRRHYVAWSDVDRSQFDDEYWPGLYRWFAHEGNRHVAAYLAELDLSGFDPKAPPPKTAAFWDIVDANRAPEDAELADLLDMLGNPAAVTVGRLMDMAEGSFGEWIRDRRNRRAIPHRLETAGYVAVRNPSDTRDGQWRVGGKRQTIYAKSTLSGRDRFAAAATLAGGR
jgi:hypothetical protein